MTGFSAFFSDLSYNFFKCLKEAACKPEKIAQVFIINFS
jgi:hypothetical protein